MCQLCYPYLNDMEEKDTLDGFVCRHLPSHENLMHCRHKMLGWNGQQIQGKVRPTEDEVAELGPEFQKAWDKEYSNCPEKPLMVFNVLAG